MQALRFSCTVFGKPQPAGSKRGFVNPRTGGVIITDANKNAKSWQQEVASAAIMTKSLIPFDEPIETGPLSLVLSFFVTRPKGHYGTGRNKGRVRDSAPGLPAVKPDLTKLVRAVEDALTGVVWRDDAQIVFQTVGKFYGLPERCEIKVYG